MSPEEWLATIRAEYLAQYVRQGGAAVKLAVAATDADRAALLEGLRGAAEEAGFVYAGLNAVDVRLHLMDRLFHAVARQVDWDDLARVFLERLLRERGLRLPPAGEPLALSRLAELNAAPEMLLRTELRRALEHQLFEDYAMTREMRLALLQLCLAQLDPTDSPALYASVREWLRGELRLLSEVKRALIFQKVARHNARHMLFSLAHWLTLCGKSGLVLALDITRYADVVRVAERGSGNYYSTAAAMDLYEVLRQMIDASDEAHSLFVGVLAGPDFLQDDRRGLRAYQALYFRIWDEVRDRERENPFAALARVAGAA